MSPSQHTRSVQPHPQTPVPAHVQTKHDQAAALMGLLAASGLTMDSLFAMGEEKQREALIAAATIHNSSRLTDQGISGSGSKNNSSSTTTVTDGSSATASATATEEAAAPPAKAAPVDPRKAMMEMIAKRAKAAAGEPADAPPEAKSSSDTPPPAPAFVKLKEDPKYSKYFKMIKVRVCCDMIGYDVT
jgi:Subunit CCDC53 of WASH complex